MTETRLREAGSHSHRTRTVLWRTRSLLALSFLGRTLSGRAGCQFGTTEERVGPL